MPAQSEKVQLDGPFPNSLPDSNAQNTNKPVPSLSLVAPLDQNFINVTLHKTVTKALVDTGACISCISEGMLKSTYPNLIQNYKNPVHNFVTGVGGQILPVLGMVDLPIVIEGEKLITPVHVFRKLHHHLILGKDFLKVHKANINFGKDTLTLESGKNINLLEAKQPLGIARNALSITIPPETGSLIPVKVSRCHTTHVALLDPVHPVTQEGALVAKCTVIVQEGKAFCQILNPTPIPIHIPAGRMLALSHPIDPTDIDTIDKNTSSVVPTPPDNPLSKHSAGVLSTSPANPLSKYSEEDNNHAPKRTEELNLDLDNNQLDPTQLLQLKTLIGHNRDVFAKDMSELGASNTFYHTIDTGDAPPQRQQYYRTTPTARAEIEKQVKEMLEHDIIEPSDAIWQSPVVLVKKKSGDYRFAVDYRRVNNVTKQISQPLPRLDSMLDTIGDAQPKFFSSLDMSSGFWQILLDPETKDKSTFTCQMGNFSFKRMPFGLVNGPATYTIMMNKVLQGLTWKFLLCYMDDILVYSRTFEEHLYHLDQVFSRLREANLKLKPSKCKFATEKVLYLGHYISADGIHANDEKIKAVKEFPKPKTIKKLRGFLGLCTYYRRFVPNFSKIAKPLYEMLKKNAKLNWGINEEQAFSKLKDLLCSAPVLSHPNFDREFILTTDASIEGIGYVLSQKNDKKEDHPISYGGRTLRSGEPNYNITELECLAIVEGLRANHIYLAHRSFKLFTDHSALQWLKNVKPTSGRLHRWALCINSYKYDVHHKPGAQNKVADALSRRPYEPQPITPNDDILEEISVLSIDPDIFSGQCTSPTNKKPKSQPATCEISLEYDDPIPPTWVDPVITVSTLSLENIEQEQRNCSDFCDIYEYLDSGQLPQNKKRAFSVVAEANDYILDDGILYHTFTPRTSKGTPIDDKIIRQLALPSKYREEALTAYHDSLMGGGHFGFDRTFNTIKRKYYWPRMYKLILAYVKSCDACQKAKRSYSKHKAPLTNMPVADKFERWHIDFIGPLTEAEDGSKYILLAVDSLTRWPEAFATKTSDSVVIADILYREIFARYGAPRVLVSDRGQNFLSKLVTALCEIFSVKRYHTSSYHPQTNSTCERFNSTLEQSIRAYCDVSHKDWPKILPGVLMSYRRSPSTHSTLYSPYYLMFGCDMHVPFDTSMTPRPKLPKSTKLYIQELKKNLDIAQEVAKENTAVAQEHSKKYYDKTSTEPTFKLGDKVLLKNGKIESKKCKKLQPKHVGPYFIVKLGPNFTYKLSKTPGGKEGRAYINANRLEMYNDPSNRIFPNTEIPEEPIPDEPNTTSDPITHTSNTGQNVRSGTNEEIQPSQNSQQAGDQWLPVDKILGTRKYGQLRYYRVKFQGDQTSHWIPQHDIAEPLLVEYHRTHTNKGRVRKNKNKRTCFTN